MECLCYDSDPVWPSVFLGQAPVGSPPWSPSVTYSWDLLKEKGGLLLEWWEGIFSVHLCCYCAVDIFRNRPRRLFLEKWQQW